MKIEIILLLYLLWELDSRITNMGGSYFLTIVKYGIKSNVLFIVEEGFIKRRDFVDVKELNVIKINFLELKLSEKCMSNKNSNKIKKSPSSNRIEYL